MTDFYEDDEDPQAIRAAFNRGPHGVTTAPFNYTVGHPMLHISGGTDPHAYCRDEIEKLTRQRDDARSLVVRSRLFETPACDCVFTDHPGGLCQVLTEEEMHAAGVETDHSVGHYPGETCERCGLGVGGRNRER